MKPYDLSKGTAHEQAVVTTLWQLHHFNGGAEYFAIGALMRRSGLNWTDAREALKPLISAGLVMRQNDAGSLSRHDRVGLCLYGFRAYRAWKSIPEPEAAS